METSKTFSTDNKDMSIGIWLRPEICAALWQKTHTDESDSAALSRGAIATEQEQFTETAVRQHWTPAINALSYQRS